MSDAGRVSGFRPSSTARVLALPLTEEQARRAAQAPTSPLVISRTSSGHLTGWYRLESGTETTTARHQLRAVVALEVGLDRSTRTPFAKPIATAVVREPAQRIDTPSLNLQAGASAARQHLAEKLARAGVKSPTALRAEGMSPAAADRAFAAAAVRANLAPDDIVRTLAVEGARRAASPRSQLRWAARQYARAVGAVKEITAERAAALAVGAVFKAAGVVIAVTRRTMRLIRTLDSLSHDR